MVLFRVLLCASRCVLFFLLWVRLLNAAEDLSECPDFLQRMKFVHVSPDSCLLFINTKKDWTDAHKTCRNLGGDLVMIKSAEKQQFILNKLRDDHWPTDGIWIGATDQDREGDWRWVDGSRLTYSHFKSGQGNNHNGGFLFASGSNEDCALLRRDDGGLWYDYRCSTTFNLPGLSVNYPFACEFQKVSRYTTRVLHVSKSSTPTIGPIATNLMTSTTVPCTDDPLVHCTHAIKPHQCFAAFTFGMRASHIQAGLCPGSNDNTADAILMKYCSSPSSDQFKPIRKVSEECKTITEFTAVSQFRHDKPTLKMGLFLHCNGTDTFEIITQDCSRGMHKQLVSWPESETFYTIGWK